MLYSEQEWDNITNYLVTKIREYCAKNSIEKDDFAKKLGISPRVLTRLYSKKINSNGIRNNRLLSSLEFLQNLANALEIDVVKLFQEINAFSHENIQKPELKEIKLSKLVDNKLIDIFDVKNQISDYISLGIFLSFLKKQSLKIILNIIINDDFEDEYMNQKNSILDKVKSIQGSIYK